MKRIPIYRLKLMWKWSAIVLTAALVSLVIFKPELPNKLIKQDISSVDSTEINKKKKSKDRRERLLSPEALAAEGKLIIFGTDQPELNEGGRMPIGKAPCPFCHLFVEGQKTDRCPILIGIEERSHLRPKEARYKMFSDKYKEESEPDSGLKPMAKTGGEYILESLYCPNCYVVEGFGMPGSDGLKSEMPIVTHMPWTLNDYQLVAIASYLQVKESPGDFSKVTARQDWERLFKEELQIPTPEAPDLAALEAAETTALVTDPLEVIVEKMRCFVCHKIPSVPIAKIGLVGPILTLKTNASLRIASPEYKKALEEGRAKAATPREYVMESIVDPGAFVLAGFQNNMPTDYKGKFTVGALNKLVDFLLTIDEDMIEAEDPSAILEDTGSRSSKFD